MPSSYNGIAANALGATVTLGSGGPTLNLLSVPIPNSARNGRVDTTHMGTTGGARTFAPAGLTTSDNIVFRCQWTGASALSRATLSAIGVPTPATITINNPTAYSDAAINGWSFPGHVMDVGFPTPYTSDETDEIITMDITVAVDGAITEINPS